MKNTLLIAPILLYILELNILLSVIQILYLTQKAVKHYLYTILCHLLLFFYKLVNFYIS